MKADSVSYEQFEARHVEKILGIDRNRLFFWVKTHRLVKPDIKGVGTGRRNTYSKKNLLELAIVKEMASFGLDLNFITDVKKMLDGIKVVVKKEGDRYVRTDVDDDLTETKSKKKFGYLDWAFNGSYPIGFWVFTDEAGDPNIMLWEWVEGTKSSEDTRLEHISYLTINVTAMAKKIEEKVRMEMSAI